jgi:hypothetical protein
VELKRKLRTYPSEGSGTVRHAFRSCHARTVGAAVEVTVRLNAVPDNLDAAVLADGGEGVDRALEAVERVRGAIGHSHLKALIVLISTHFALGHLYSPLPGRATPGLKVTTLVLIKTNA